MLKFNDHVRLLTAYRGIHPRTDHEVLLPGGAVGTVIEARNPETVIVEFLATDGDILAWASVNACKILRGRG